MADDTAVIAASGKGEKTSSSHQTLLEHYLGELKEIRSSGSGVAETSYYPALSDLFNAVGKTLKPRIRCIMNLGNLGAGMPDGGLFTPDQFQRQSDAVPRPDKLKPARGAMEVKGAKPEIAAIVQTQQVKDYLATYGIVIVTNLREFAIFEADAAGTPVQRESFAIADSESDFWQKKAAHPRATAQSLGDQFGEFIKRACLHNAPLSNPKDLAWFLASYARDALARVEQQKNLPALQNVRAALEEALGMKFIGEKGEHFFRSTLVQTLFYGVFSAWVRWHRDNPAPASAFDWRTAEWTLHVPFIRALYEEVSKPSTLGPLGLVEVLQWAAAALNRVNRAEFFRKFQQEQAVQYFYEPFLEAYDPELRKALGVWYTPPEIVKYQVARVDTVLREELDLPDGLADPNVIILDPCCGTGAYLVEVLHKIAETLRDRGGDALVASDLKTAAMNRVFGFEILPAPFVIAHLQLGLLLQNQGTPLSDSKSERVAIYLTNALTGWEPPKEPKNLLFPELEAERDAAEHIKRNKKILVVLGNPPYNAFAGVSPEEEKGLVEPYKEKLNAPLSKGGWGIRKYNLDDLYVRFFRLAERRIAEMTGTGIISFISNFSYLSDPSFVVMRQRLLSEFDKLWFDSLNGDSRETGKLTPEGEPDPSIFSTEYNREGIRVGTAICVMARKVRRQRTADVRFRNFWGADKRTNLCASLKSKSINRSYKSAHPLPANRLSLRPEDVSAAFSAWPSVISLCALQPISGLQEMRRGALMSYQRANLQERMERYFDRKLSWDDLVGHGGGLVKNAGRFDAKNTRSRLIKTEQFSAESIRRYALYPFDTRWCYHSNSRPIWNEPRPEVVAQAWSGNRFFVTRAFAERPHEWAVATLTGALPDYHLLRPNAVAIPLLIRNGERLSTNQHATLFDALGEKPSPKSPTANLSRPVRKYLMKLGVDDPDSSVNESDSIWMHALATCYSPSYLTENADGIRRDWPRIPLPASRKALEASATIGRQLASILEDDIHSPGITSGKTAPVFRVICRILKMDGAPIDPSHDDLAVSSGWGHPGKGGITMPGSGKLIERPYDADELKAIDSEATARKMKSKDVLQLLGSATCDIYLNHAAYWKNIPVNVWNYHIGGYQVLKKWLSYREHKLLGRALLPDEAREFMNIARRLAAIILLQPEFDENYRQVTANTFDWSTLV